MGEQTNRVSWPSPCASVDANASSARHKVNDPKAPEEIWPSSAPGRLEDLDASPADRAPIAPPGGPSGDAHAMTVERYSGVQAPLWNAFVRTAKNGIFMFDRAYMDYHSDRFDDHSLLVREGPRLVALLPGHIKGTALVSHGGLSFGGFVVDDQMTLPLMLRVFEATLSSCRQRGHTIFVYKAIPSIYHRLPAQEDLYALHLCDATLVERSVSSAVALKQRPRMSSGRKYALSKARRSSLAAGFSEDFDAFWSLLEERLLERHRTRPVHSLAEIRLLHDRFPGNIRLVACHEGESMVAGVVIFESDCVAKTQYIAASARGRELGGLDLIFDRLINELLVDKPFLDFGTSHDPTTHAINAGLLFQKESFGGRTVVQDIHSIDLLRWESEPLRRALD
jgi:Acetyltransferase (GNAT) domain